MKTCVSVIIPIYNINDSLLIKSINSVINQTYKNIELLLVDDGSTISNKKICDEFAENDERIKVFHIENAGVSNARNVGIKESKGGYIMFVDADDWIDENCIETCINKNITNNKEYDIIFFGYKKVFNSKTITVDFFENDTEFNLSNNECKKKIYDMRVLGSSCMKIYKKSIINELFDIELKNGEDVYFNYCNIINANEICYVHNVYYNYNLHDNSAVRSSNEDIVNRYIKTFSKMQNNTNNNLISLKYSFIAISLLVLILNYCFPKKSSYFKNKSKLKKVLKQQEFKNMFANIKYIRLPLSRKIGVYLCKYRLLFLIYIMSKIKHKFDE